MAIVRKSDNVIEFVINGGDGLPLTISTMVELEILVYQLPKTIIQRWLITNGDITIINDISGIVEVRLDRANTKLLNFKSDAKAEVAGSFTDATFEGGIRREVDTDIELTIVEDSPTAYEA